MTTVQIPLTQGYFATIDEADYEEVSKFKWQALVNERFGKVYAQANCGDFVRPGALKRKKLTLHRFLMNPPPRIPVDHIDNDGLNNTRLNLRVCTTAQNALNTKAITHRAGRPVASRLKGVTLVKNKWIATLNGGGKARYLGSFDSEVEAGFAWDDAARQLHGQFASTNAMLGLLPDYQWVDWEDCDGIAA